MGWLPGYAYRKPLVITGGASGAQTDFQLDIDIAHVAAKMQADFDDIRFTQNNGTTLIDAWLESKVDSASAKTYIKAPSTPANGVSDPPVYMYYGKVVANYWDIRATMLDGDDFPGVSLDAAIWDNQNCNVGVSGGVLTLDTFTGGLTGGVMGKRLLTIPYIIESRVKNVYDGDEARIGSSNVWGFNADDSMVLGLNSNDVVYLYTWNEGAIAYAGGDAYNENQYYKIKIIADGTDIHAYLGGVELTNSPITTNLPDEPMYLRIAGDAGYSPTVKTDWIFARKYAANPPTYAFGAEESAPTAGNPFWYYNMLRMRNQ